MPAKRELARFTSTAKEMNFVAPADNVLPEYYAMLRWLFLLSKFDSSSLSRSEVDVVKVRAKTTRGENMERFGTENL
ncbi:hypothetical protein HYALB_00005225 [Hymenoscyphus albidus]|uniref:Uncharacterized protein n=1 Tax=Hymenoscyphus albidus TaxID=595503 RepID=A0A9N9LS67_9HELO|nr:hypothetical protein HYALB_00005225 [Hymenoscyphus albidus]